MTLERLAFWGACVAAGMLYGMAMVGAGRHELLVVLVTWPLAVVAVTAAHSLWVKVTV